MQNIDTIVRNGTRHKVGFCTRSVWKNSNPTANFAAQEVTLTGSSSWFLVKTKTAATVDGYTYTVVQAGVLSVCLANYHGNRSRAVTISGNTATFETGYSGGTAGTSHAIPVEIFTL